MGRKKNEKGIWERQAELVMGILGRKVRGYNTLPVSWSRSDVGEMVTEPGAWERQLRQVSGALYASCMSYRLMVQAYPNMMTCRWVVTPRMRWRDTLQDTQIHAQSVKPSDAQSAKSESAAKAPVANAVLSDVALGEEIARKMQIPTVTQEIMGLCMLYGKVFYTPRVSIDWERHRVNYAWLQQLPEDWCRIAGRNNGPGKYTVEFNTAYFAETGKGPEEFGNLFDGLLESDTSTRSAGSSLNATQWRDYGMPRDLTQHDGMPRDLTQHDGMPRDLTQHNGTPRDLTQHSQWQSNGSRGREWDFDRERALYGTSGSLGTWVTLPRDKVIVFEADPASDLVIPPLTGMMMSLLQLPEYEELQLELKKNPLTAILTGSLETSDNGGIGNNDPLRISPTVRRTFETYYYKAMESLGVGTMPLFLAPAKDLKLQSLPETSNENISQNAVAGEIMKAGLSALIPATTEPKVGVAQISAELNARIPELVYRRMEIVMEQIFDSLDIRTELGFRMFGNVFNENNMKDETRQAMTLGITSALPEWLALRGLTVGDDLCISRMVEQSGIMDLRQPLSSSYGTQFDYGQTENTDPEKGGRPAEEGSINGEMQEKLLF